MKYAHVWTYIYIYICPWNLIVFILSKQTFLASVAWTGRCVTFFTLAFVATGRSLKFVCMRNIVLYLHFIHHTCDALGFLPTALLYKRSRIRFLCFIVALCFLGLPFAKGFSFQQSCCSLFDLWSIFSQRAHLLKIVSRKFCLRASILIKTRVP